MTLQRQRVRLLCDLTRYRGGLVVGTLGWTDPWSDAQWGVIVNYDNGARLDTLRNSLEILEDETKAEAARLLLAQLRDAVRDLSKAGYTKRQLQKEVSEAVDAAKPKRIARGVEHPAPGASAGT